MTRASLALCALLLGAAPCAGQFPAELAGRVVERASGRGIADAIVEIDGGARALTDASGAFLLRSPVDGTRGVRVTRIGYAELTTTVRLESGRSIPVVYQLEVAPVELEALEVRALPADARGLVLTREAIERSGARTLGELLVTVPGVVVRGDGGGGTSVSIRGGSADDVLVLVDGAPVNDPVTGAADLSLVPLHGVESVEILPGARSAQLGARAQSGAIVVRTTDARASSASLSTRAGSLGAVDASGAATLALQRVGIGAGARFHDIDGAFRFTRPAALGGGAATRENVGATEAGGFVTLSLAGLRVRAEHARAERGLPGPLYAPTPEARQRNARSGGSAAWLARIAGAEARLDAYGSWQRLRYEDPDPAVGEAYFDTTDARDLGARAEVERARGRWVQAVGAEVRTLRLESSALEPRVVERTDPSVFGRAALDLRRVRLGLAARADRWGGGWIVSHDANARASFGAVDVEVAHRSAFSPPAAGDQFFGSGIAIEPNPDLRPERVRSELELGASGSFALGGVPIAMGASAFVGDVDGMIVWTPDFRFVWSPRNRDVQRSGGEAWLRAQPLRDVAASSWLNVARVTYDWPGDADSVQLVYRPRYSGGVVLDWTRDAWRAGLQGLYTGRRYATPGESNPLPGYWDVRALVGREWRRGPALFALSARVERLFDNTDSFIHGYPEPGRRLALELSVRPRDVSFTETETTDR